MVVVVVVVVVVVAAAAVVVVIQLVALLLLNRRRTYDHSGVAGTSCATPTASGIIALLNDARLQNNMSTLGFLNPFIYKNIGLWNDIATGSSDGCTGDDGWCDGLRTAAAVAVAAMVDSGDGNGQ